MVFPLPDLGSHTAIFGGVGTGKTALLKGITVEAARRHRVFYASLEDSLRPSDFSALSGDITILTGESLDKLDDRLAESIIAIDAAHFITMSNTPFARLAPSAEKLGRIVKQATRMGSSLIVTFQLNRTASNKPEIVREHAPWNLFANQWALANRPDPNAEKGHLRATCMKSASGCLGEVFNFRPWR